MSTTILPEASPVGRSRSVRLAVRPSVLPVLLQLCLVLAVVYA